MKLLSRLFTLSFLALVLVAGCGTHRVFGQSTTNLTIPIDAWKQNGTQSDCPVMGGNNPTYQKYAFTEFVALANTASFQPIATGCYDGTSTTAACEVNDGVPGGCWGGYAFQTEYTSVAGDGKHHLKNAMEFLLWRGGPSRA